MRPRSTAALAVALSIGWSGFASAQETGELAVTTAPVIVGNPVIGSTLRASGGAWRSPNPEASRTQAWWEWWRCPTRNANMGCDLRARNGSYAAAAADSNEYLFLRRLVSWRDTKNTPIPLDDTLLLVQAVSAPAGPMPAAPTPVPTRTPTPTPTRTPAPTPTRTPTPERAPVPTTPSPAPAPGSAFEAPAAPASDAAPRETAPAVRILRPFPVVRMKGRLTVEGANVQLLSVRSPRAARIAVSCRGRGCPATRWSRSARTRLTRIARFERNLRAGVALTITVTRDGYIGKHTRFVIRRGAPPLRSDRCLSNKARSMRCPAGLT